MSRRDRQISRFLATLAVAVEQGDVSGTDVWQVLTEPRPTGYTIEAAVDHPGGSEICDTLLHLHSQIQAMKAPAAG